MNFRSELIAVGLVLAAGTLFAERPVFILNEDNDHFFKRASAKMTRAALVDYVDHFAQGQVTHFFMCPSGQRANFDSPTVEPIWLGIDETAEPSTATAKDGTHDRWAVNVKKLFDAGLDPYAIWIERCRQKGVSPWFTLRMNDVHGMSRDPKNGAYFRTSTFNRTRTDLWCNPHGNRSRDMQLNYAHREVRDYMLRHLVEVAERWDADGIELDWMRYGYCLAEGRERTDARFVTAFVAEVRQRLDQIGRRRGRRIKLGVRVPRDLKSARSVGLAVDEWMRGKLVDLVVPSCRLVNDIELPIDQWLEYAKKIGFAGSIVPALDINTGESAPRNLMTPELYRGCLERWYARGAGGAYFFNLPYINPVADRLYAEGIAPETVRRGTREYLKPVQDFPPAK